MGQRPRDRQVLAFEHFFNPIFAIEFVAGVFLIVVAAAVVAITLLFLLFGSKKQDIKMREGLRLCNHKTTASIERKVLLDALKDVAFLNLSALNREKKS